VTFSSKAESDVGAIQTSVEAFGAYLIATGKINEIAFHRAIKHAAESNEQFGTVLTRLGLISERDLTEEYSKFLDLLIVDQSRFPDAPILEDRLSPKFLHEARIIPLEDQPTKLVIALTDPFDTDAIDAVRFDVGKELSIQITYPSDFEIAPD
jgi:general secretion pathway protein E